MHELSSKHPISSTPFEVFYNGSWHGVNFVSIINGRTFIPFGSQGPVAKNEISADYIRLRSRKANVYDCSHLLKVGVDVCVLSTRRISESSDERPPNLPLLYDAKIISKKTNPHDGRCSCLFSVILYKERAVNGTGKNMLFERAEMVKVDKISILQKLSDEPRKDGLNQWSYAEDCISSSRSRLLGGIVSSEISWLVVLSIVKNIIFHIKLFQRRIVYQILDQKKELVPDSDFSSVKNLKDITLLCFYRLNEMVKPVFKTLKPLVDVEEELLELDEQSHKNEPIDVDSETDVEVLYDCMSLRRSKRQKIEPDRFTSYSEPNFNRTTRNEEQIVNGLENDGRLSGFVEDEHLLDDFDLCLVQRSSDDEYELPQVSGRKEMFEWAPKPARTPLVLTMGEEGTCKVPPSNSPDRQTQDGSVKMAKGGRGRGRPRTRDRGIPTARNSKPFYRKRPSYRKKLLLSAAECEQIIQQCMGKMKKEMEAEADATAPSADTFPDETEDFKWSPSPEAQYDNIEHENLWKEMEHTLDKLAFLEKQEQEFETYGGSVLNSSEHGDQACSHDFKLDEQIGIICQLCNFVQTDIRDVMPKFVTSDSWNTSKEHWGREEVHMTWPYNLDSFSFDVSFSNLDVRLLEGDGNVWTLIPELKLKLYAHQKKAFEFIWRNIAGSLKPKDVEINSGNTGGCVISHSPGSGKTLLLISFIVSYLRLFPRSRPLILAPKIAIYVWRKEFEKWGFQFPLHVIHPIQSFRKEILDFKIKIALRNHGRPNRKMRHLVDCMSKLQQWHKESSVLLMSYTSFFLMQKESKDEHKKFIAKILQKSPGLLVLDEGHNPRSTISKLRKLLMEVQTKSRILLSGTLFQNNFEEYFNTLCLARPSFVDDVLRELDQDTFTAYTKSEKRSKRKERVARKLFVQRIGEKIESCMVDERKQGFDVLNKITNGFLDTYEDDYSDKLPGLHIYTLVLVPTEIQQEVLLRLHSCLKLTRRYPIELELLITVGSIHPWLIKTMAHAEDYFNDSELEKIETYKDSFKSGSKVKFVFDIVQKSIVNGEKVLIFAHNIPPISLLVRYFEKFLGWQKGQEVLVLQGDQEMSLRAKTMDRFNGDVENICKVLIASTSACAEGISLTAASRVVLLDSEWNHSKTRQAIARAFRPGQEREVYVYKLLASGTWEEDKYRSNEWKAWLSKMVSMGEYYENKSCRKVDVVDDDDMLRELWEEDRGNMFQMIMEQNRLPKICR